MRFMAPMTAMKTLSLAVSGACVFAANPVFGQSTSAREFSVRSRDGVVVHGRVDSPTGYPGAAVILVAGTGPFDRDVRFGRSNSPRDFLFRDLSARLTRRGLITVRYDARGVPAGGQSRLGAEASQPATTTAQSQIDDLRAIYDWTRSAEGLGQRCIVFFGHSEGIMHIAGLARSGAPAPLLVVGMGAPMRSPVDVMRWQLAERGVDTLRAMDTDRDGVVTEAEIETNWRNTPAASFPAFEHGRPRGPLAETDLERIGAAQAAAYERARRAALAMEDTAPFPSAAAPIARASWWKNWFTDREPIANRLASWPIRISLHYGDIDSQTPPRLEAPAARAALAGRVNLRVHPGRGHSLGVHPLLGPIDENIADSIADEIAATPCGAQSSPH